MSRGKFIVIEGIDGAGKTSQIALIKDILDKKGINVHLTRECSDGPIGQLLRYTYLAGKRKVDRRLINILYAADRIDHLTNDVDGVLWYLEQGTHVICDRYYHTSMSYYAAEYFGTEGYMDAMNYILELNKVSRELVRPDLTIYIEVSPQVALQRLHAEREETEGLSVYENLDHLIHASVGYNSAFDLLSRDGEQIARVSGERPAPEVTDSIIGVMSTVIPELWK